MNQWTPGCLLLSLKKKINCFWFQVCNPATWNPEIVTANQNTSNTNIDKNEYIPGQWGGWKVPPTNSMDMSLSKLQERVKEREAWHTALHGVPKSRTWL